MSTYSNNSLLLFITLEPRSLTLKPTFLMPFNVRPLLNVHQEPFSVQHPLNVHQNQQYMRIMTWCITFLVGDQTFPRMKTVSGLCLFNRALPEAYSGMKLSFWSMGNLQKMTSIKNRNRQGSQRGPRDPLKRQTQARRKIMCAQSPLLRGNANQGQPKTGTHRKERRRRKKGRSLPSRTSL